MKKLFTLALAALLLLSLAGCGSDGKTPAQVDLTAFYEDAAKEYGWEETAMIDLTDDMLDSYYPGLRDLTAKQLVAKMPQMSSVVNELVLLECETEEDATKAAAILQDRVTAQAEGGAWYPESMEAWSRATVTQQGNCVALIASAEHQDDLTERFNGLFA